MSGLPNLPSFNLSRHSPDSSVLLVDINRPKRLNAMGRDFWVDMITLFRAVDEDSQTRVVVLAGGSSKHYTAGLDLNEFNALVPAEDVDIARKSLRLRKMILSMQESFNVLEHCRVPVIAAIHGGCVGGGIDMITACDIRIASSDAWFTVKEVDIGLAADVGTLQRLPKVVGSTSRVMDWALTGRRFDAAEAASSGLVSTVVQGGAAEVKAAALSTAALIAAKSPVAVVGTKHNINYSRSHSVDESLKYMALWNASMLHTEDVTAAVGASMSKTAPTFSKL